MIAIGYLAPDEIFENMLQLMRFSVNFERILNTNNDYFHIEIMISATHMLGGSGACSPVKVLKEWCDLVRFDVYFVNILSLKITNSSY